MTRGRSIRVIVGLVLSVTAVFAIALSQTITTSRESATVPIASPTAAASPGNPKLEAAARSTPQAPKPTPPPFDARSPADVLRNLPNDATWQIFVAGLTGGAQPDPRAVGKAAVPGTPIFVRSIGKVDGTDEYVVPVLVEGRPIAIVVVDVDAAGRGQIHAMRGWSHPLFPRADQTEAIARAGAVGDPGASAELVWANVRGLAGPLQPFWRVSRSNGKIYYVFEDDVLVESSGVGLE